MYLFFYIYLQEKAENFFAKTGKRESKKLLNPGSSVFRPIVLVSCLEVNGSILNIVSAYALQVNNSMEEKNDFWEDLDGLIESISKEERIVLGADLNGHVGEGNIGDEEIMGRYGAGTRNKEESMVVWHREMRVNRSD